MCSSLSLYQVLQPVTRSQKPYQAQCSFPSSWLACLWTRSQGPAGPYQVILLGDLEQQGTASTVVGKDEVDLLQGPQLDDAEHREPAIQDTNLSGLQMHKHRPAGLLVALPFQRWGEMGLGQMGSLGPPCSRQTQRKKGSLELELDQGLHSSLPLLGY